MEYLRKFNEHYDYSTDENIPLTNDGITTSYCETDFHIHYRYDENDISNNTNYNFNNAKFGDILYSDYYGNLMYTSEILSPSLGFIPIGLCINKGPSYTMSLKCMSYTSPESGSLKAENMFWGSTSYISNITDLPNPYKNSSANSVSIYPPIIDDDAYVNLLTSYKEYNYNGTIYLVPGDNSNFNINVLGANNSYALTDCNGSLNTYYINAIAHNNNDPDYDTWIRTPQVDNTTNVYPAAACCTRYHTLGERSAEWYLPSCGELAMVLHFKGFIEAILQSIYSVYPTYCMPGFKNQCYWTSTECNYNQAWAADFNNGTIFKAYKNTNEYGVIAFVKYYRAGSWHDEYIRY